MKWKILSVLNTIDAVWMNEDVGRKKAASGSSVGKHEWMKKKGRIACTCVYCRSWSSRGGRGRAAYVRTTQTTVTINNYAIQSHRTWGGLIGRLSEGKTSASAARKAQQKQT